MNSRTAMLFQEPIQIWKAIVPKPCSRSFIVGSVGTGKSTLGGSLLEYYSYFFHSHRLFIIDPKQRFFVDRNPKSGILFPDGTTSVNHGRRDGVTVNAYQLDRISYYGPANRGCYVIQDEITALRFFDWILHHHDIRKPVLIYLDESFDFVHGVRAYAVLRKIIQMGRELGIGIIIVNQRPSYIDTTFLSESGKLYIGTLHNVKDRRKIVETITIPNARDLLEPMPRHTFYMVNQIHPESSFPFTIKKGLAAS